MSGDTPNITGNGSGDSGSAASSESSAPLSTSDIASTVVEQYDTSTESATPPAEAPPPQGNEPLSDEEQLLQDLGFKHRLKPDGREHYFPRSKMAAVIAEGLKRSREKWAAEHKPATEELEQLRTFRDGFREQLQGDETAFLNAIAQLDPRYKRFLEQRAAEAQEQQQPDEEPKGDLDLGNGVTTFSPQGLQKWLAWAVKQQLAPLHKEREEQKRLAAEAQEQRAQAAEVRQQMTDAQTWPNWQDYAPDILKKLQEDTKAARAAGKRPRMTLREAYLDVKAERLAQGATHAREQAIADLKNAPRKTGLGAGTEVPRTVGPSSTADIARRVIERAERNGS